MAGASGTQSAGSTVVAETSGHSASAPPPAQTSGGTQTLSGEQAVVRNLTEQIRTGMMIKYPILFRNGLDPGVRLIPAFISAGDFFIPTELGFAVQGTNTQTMNCFACSLGTRNWLQTESDGYVYESDTGRNRVKKYGRATMDNIPKLFGGTPLPDGQTCSQNSYQVRIFSDSSKYGNFHIMSQTGPGGSWTSKNGSSYFFVGVKSADTFYRYYFQPTGQVNTYNYCMPLSLLK